MADGYLTNRTLFQDKSTAVVLSAASTTQDNVLTGRTGHTLYVQRIKVSVTTDAAQSWTFQDDNSSARVIAVTPTSPGVGMLEWDFGAEGVPLTEAKNLDISVSGAGLAGIVMLEAYLKQTSTLSMTASAAT